MVTINMAGTRNRICKGEKITTLVLVIVLTKDVFFPPKTWQLDTEYFQNLDPPRKKQNSNTSPLFAGIYLYVK